MKTEKFQFVSSKNPVLIAKGVKGGGHVAISAGLDVSFYTKDMLSDLSSGVQISKFFTRIPTLYLKEGEELYSVGQYGTAYTVSIDILYLNEEQFSNEPQVSPINLSGTIQLNQQ